MSVMFPAVALGSLRPSLEYLDFDCACYFQITPFLTIRVVVQPIQSLAMPRLCLTNCLKGECVTLDNSICDIPQPVFGRGHELLAIKC